MLHISPEWTTQGTREDIENYIGSTFKFLGVGWHDHIITDRTTKITRTFCDLIVLDPRASDIVEEDKKLYIYYYFGETTAEEVKKCYFESMKRSFDILTLPITTSKTRRRMAWR